VGAAGQGFRLAHKALGFKGIAGVSTGMLSYFAKGFLSRACPLSLSDCESVSASEDLLWLEAAAVPRSLSFL